MSLISHTEAEELRGKAVEEHGSTWLHFYHEYVVEAALKKLGITPPAVVPEEPSVEWLPADDSEGGNC